MPSSTSTLAALLAALLLATSCSALKDADAVTPVTSNNSAANNSTANNSTANNSTANNSTVNNSAPNNSTVNNSTVNNNPPAPTCADLCALFGSINENKYIPGSNDLEYCLDFCEDDLGEYVTCAVNPDGSTPDADTLRSCLEMPATCEALCDDLESEGVLRELGADENACIAACDDNPFEAVGILCYEEGELDGECAREELCIETCAEIEECGNNEFGSVAECEQSCMDDGLEGYFSCMFNTRTRGIESNSNSGSCAQQEVCTTCSDSCDVLDACEVDSIEYETCFSPCLASYSGPIAPPPLYACAEDRWEGEDTCPADQGGLPECRCEQLCDELIRPSDYLGDNTAPYIPDSPGARTRCEESCIIEENATRGPTHCLGERLDLLSTHVSAQDVEACAPMCDPLCMRLGSNSFCAGVGVEAACRGACVTGAWTASERICALYASTPAEVDMCLSNRAFRCE